MASWKEILDEIQKAGSTQDVVRRQYLAGLHTLTGRYVIAYYSGWLQKPELGRDHPETLSISDGDKNGFRCAA